MFDFNDSRAALLKAKLNATARCGRSLIVTPLLVLTLLAFGATHATFTQVLYSSLTGKVDDQKGVAVPGVKVEARNVEVFTYDQSVAFDLKEESAKDQDGVTIRDVNYAAYTPRRGRIKAYLIQPGGKGPFAGVLFFHWYGTPNGNRDQFLTEAKSLAKQGTASLLIQGYFPWAVPPVDATTDRQRVIDETIEVRRALDLLLSQPQVDPKRIGYVGHDYGAMYGAITAGVDKRVKAYILIAGIGSFSNWSLDYWLKAIPAADKEAYRLAFKEIDPTTEIARAAPATLLFQFANSDEHIKKEEAMAFFGAASKPKQVRWYEGKHELNVEAARDDRREWLTRQLRLAKRPGIRLGKIKPSWCFTAS